MDRIAKYGKEQWIRKQIQRHKNNLEDIQIDWSRYFKSTEGAEL